LGVSENGVLRKLFDQKKKNITVGWRTPLWFWGVLASKETSPFVVGHFVCILPWDLSGLGVNELLPSLSRPINLSGPRPPLCSSSITLGHSW
jgi:hypothetical protein